MVEPKHIASKFYFSLAIFCLAADFLLAPRTANAAEKAVLETKVGNYTEFFTATNQTRHDRFELELTQKSAFNNTVSSVVDGRWRYDAALMRSPDGPHHNYPQPVRDDEMAESEARQAYLDILTQDFRIKSGIMLIDWVDALSPIVNDELTPIDLRFGGFGDPKDVIVPVGALSLNHAFPGGSLEWLVVPLPAHSRLPKGDNGYGLIPLLEDKLDGARYEFVDEKIPTGAKSTEAGLRYLAQFGGLEWTLLAYHGHMRTPSVAVEAVNQGQIFRLHLTYPGENTYGTSFVYAGEAWVARALIYYEPNRMPDFWVADPAPPVRPREQRSRAGAGFDYTFSRHLKLYSEAFGTKTEVFPHSDKKKKSASDLDNPRSDYTGVLRLTNETFKDIEFNLDTIATSPKKSGVLAPAVKIKLPSNFDLSLGARLIRSYDPQSEFEVLKHASHVYVSLFKHLTTR